MDGLYNHKKNSNDSYMTYQQPRKNPPTSPQQGGSVKPDGEWDREIEQIEMKIKSAYPEFEICIVCIPHPSDDKKRIPVLCYDSRNGNKFHPFDFSALFSDREIAHFAPSILCRVDRIPRRNNVILRKELQKKVLKTMKFDSSLQDKRNS